MSSDDVLSELEGQLRAADSVMEPGVLDLVAKYCRSGGKPSQAIELLSENYTGYAQMCNVMCQWLEIADVHLNSSSSRPSSAADDAQVPDAFTLLSELTRERFDSTKYLGVFRKGVPPWLTELISNRRGRQLIYELSASHRNSLLLNYAIQRILKQGHEDEVAQVGGSLACYFEVYHRLLSTRLVAATRASTAQQLSQIAAEIAESCVGSQHTYVHAQQLLTAAASWPNGVVFRRLSQEVEAAAVVQHGGPRVYQLQPLFVLLSATLSERLAVQLVSEILVKCVPTLPRQAGAAATTAQPGSSAQAAVQLSTVSQQLLQLQELFSEQEGLTVQPLQHPQFMQLLLSGMFATDSSKLQQQHGQQHGSKPHNLTATCIQLLALAVAGGQQQEQQQQQHAPGDQQPLRGVSPVAQQQGVRVDDVALQLQQALQLGRKVSGPKGKLGPAELEMATQVCKQPIAALGLLQQSEQLLGDEKTIQDDQIMHILPNHLALLHRVACEQPSLIAQVLGVLRSVLTGLGPNKQDLSKKVLNFLVGLMVSGAADMVMAMAVKWADVHKADPSLIRYFIMLVLESVQPPYSQSFARPMLSVMQHSLFVRLKASHTTMLREFAAGCKELTWLPPLNRKDMDLLDELAK